MRRLGRRFRFCGGPEPVILVNLDSRDYPSLMNREDRQLRTSLCLLMFKLKQVWEMYIIYDNEEIALSTGV